LVEIPRGFVAGKDENFSGAMRGSVYNLIVTSGRGPLISDKHRAELQEAKKMLESEQVDARLTPKKRPTRRGLRSSKRFVAQYASSRESEDGRRAANRDNLASTR